MRGFQPAHGAKKGASKSAFANGGPVRGPGTGTSDEVEEEVPSGTYIMPADSTAAMGEKTLAGMGRDVPVQLSNGEFKLPPEQVHAVGVQALGGGNTRLVIAKELFKAGDQRFARLHVIVKAWAGHARTIAAHLAENKMRGDISFWENADRRITATITDVNASRWTQAVARGPQGFEEACLEAATVQVQSLDGQPAIALPDLYQVLAAPDVGFSLTRLMAVMERIRLSHPERFLPGWEPLF